MPAFIPSWNKTTMDEILIATGGPEAGTGLHWVPGWEPLQLQFLLSRAGCYPESGFRGSWI